MAAHTFDPAAFRLLFPAFADTNKYPDTVLSGYFSWATIYVDKNDNCFLSGDALQMALNLMTAHIAYLMTQAGGTAATGGLGGGVGGVLTAASIDKVSVTVAAPPTRDGWEYWLASSPYGQQLWAMLLGLSVGGVYIGGLPERRGFRKVYGTFQ